MLNKPYAQVEYEIYLLSSQAQSLLDDRHKGKSPKAFENNITELKKLSSIISYLIYTIEKEE